MSSTWVIDAENKIFTTIRYKVLEVLEETYPDLYFTRSQKNDELPNNLYPAVYIHFSEIERGKDLQGNSINAVLMSMTIDVTASESMGIESVREVIYECLDIAKGYFSFGTEMMPEEITQDTDTERMVCKLARIIGFNDIL